MKFHNKYQIFEKWKAKIKYNSMKKLGIQAFFFVSLKMPD